MRRGEIPDAPKVARIHVKALEREPWYSLCVECGPNVNIDEDGCCVTCGGAAVGAWLYARLRKGPKR